MSTPNGDRAPYVEPLWATLPDDLHSLSYGDTEASVIFAAMERVTSDPLIGDLLDVLRLTIRHVDALHNRIDQLPENACETCGAVCCCCAYDAPDDICLTHSRKVAMDA